MRDLEQQELNAMKKFGRKPIVENFKNASEMFRKEQVAAAITLAEADFEKAAAYVKRISEEKTKAQTQVRRSNDQPPAEARMAKGANNIEYETETASSDDPNMYVHVGFGEMYKVYLDTSKMREQNEIDSTEKFDGEAAAEREKFDSYNRRAKELDDVAMRRFNADVAAAGKEIEERRPCYEQYKRLIRGFTPGDDIQDLFKKVKKQFANDRVRLIDRAVIFRKCLSGDIKKVFQAISKEMLNNYGFLNYRLIQTYRETIEIV